MYERATTEMLPKLKRIAEQMIANIEQYPSSPYTASVIENLDKILCMIDRCEGFDTQPCHTPQEEYEAQNGR